ncbi:transcriptional regulator [Photorhabdus sp. UCH-936]|nr:transcriptional regulator [Photorhabdus antumapuensis]MCA6222181.1 transcriptional regulator [Photorhabdus antumapuensis]
MAQWSSTEDGAILLVENHCPICATACQGFCHAELNVFQDILQAQVERVEYMLTNSRRCAYRITSNIQPE